MVKMTSALFAILLGVLCITQVRSDWNELMESHENFEGDIELNETQALILNSQNAFGLTKVGMVTRWPSNVPIAYVIHSDHEIRRKQLEDALKDYEANTCLRFKKRTNEKSYIHFGPGRGCSSPIGMQSNGNFIRLAPGCFSRGTLLHEVAHSLGIWHEQNRPDRDQYIKIRPENMACCSSQFRKMSTRYIDSLGFPYDLDSMMHYGKYAFGNGKGPTIEPLDKTRRIGQRRGFSKIDIQQINAMYCKGTTPPPPKTTNAPTKTPTSAPRTKVFKHASSNMCLALNHNSELIFSANCNTRFEVMDGKLWHTKDYKCGEPVNSRSESPIKFKVNCNQKFSKVNQNGRYFTLRHDATGKCIHPNRGSSHPTEGTKAIIFHSCTAGRRIQFEEV